MTAAVPGPAAPDALAAALAPDLVAVIGYLTAPEPARPAVTDAAGPAPEVVKVRLSGERAGIETVLPCSPQRVRCWTGPVPARTATTPASGSTSPSAPALPRPRR